MRQGALAALAAGLLACACTPEPPVRLDAEIIPQDSGTSASLRGLAVVDAQTAWIGAPDGQVLRTVDGGQTWTLTRIPGAEGLDLRSVHSFDADHAVFATAGQPARLYVTHDGGESFQTVWEDASGQAFFDGMDFWNDQYGIAFSDPVDGRFLILLTGDGGETWRPAEDTPEALEGEAGFAASDSAIGLTPSGCAFIGTGGGETARMLRSCDFGESWGVADTPLAAGRESAGVFSVDATGERIVAVGGDFADEERSAGNFAWSDDGGNSWDGALEPPHGYRSAVTHLPGHPDTLIATGPNGTDISRNSGEIWVDWAALDGHHAIAFAPDGTAGWAVGSDGRITRVEVTPGP
ncbi:MAG: oxidoreductase [Pseudomonadota bacterium]|nr:oxidoreductase [Pseudomonadota bacterium]